MFSRRFSPVSTLKVHPADENNNKHKDEVLTVHLSRCSYT